MLYNQEFQRFTILYALLSIVVIIATGFLSILYAIAASIVCALFYLMFFMFTYKRYSAIKELSSYLQLVYQGRETMDIRSYCEGELSILKSELYKVTSVLKDQAEALQKDKSFLANSLSDISHQLKTPLTSMMVLSDLLQEELPEIKRIEFIQQIQTQLKRTEWLVSSLLKLSKIDANAIQFRFQQKQLYGLLEAAALPLRIPMEVREQTFHIECAPEIMIRADENWIIEAFSNIIKNCIEHTLMRGSLFISVQDNPLHTMIMIKDNGTGIDEHDLPHIFERFYKGKNAANDSAGIGLALSKTILNQHQARIQVESKVGEGTCFYISITK